MCAGQSVHFRGHIQVHVGEGEKTLHHPTDYKIASMELKQGLSKRNAPRKAFIWQNQSSAAGGKQLTGDPAHLEFRLWLMTQQIEPVISRHDVSCPFGPRKQPPHSKTAVSQWCSPFSPHPL